MSSFLSNLRNDVHCLKSMWFADKKQCETHAERLDQFYKPQATQCAQSNVSATACVVGVYPHPRFAGAFDSRACLSAHAACVPAAPDKPLTVAPNMWTHSAAAVAQRDVAAHGTAQSISGIAQPAATWPVDLPELMIERTRA